jgi:hypothetical protein
MGVVLCFFGFVLLLADLDNILQHDYFWGLVGLGVMIVGYVIDAYEDWSMTS